jgi:hypothetical protein
MHTFSISRLTLVAFLLLGCSIPLASAQAPEAAADAGLTILEGTPVRVRIIERLDTGTRPQVGAMVNFEVADPIYVDGQMVIRPGARATGTITHAKKAKWAGRKGELDFTIDYVQAVDGQNISLRSTAQGRKGGGNVGVMAATVALASVAGILIRGKNAVVEEGTEFTAYSNQNRTIQP